ncbi:MAG: UxaA family hydrolase [Actinomycetota bacterium]|nr:UxaA family hydrolase [Actinomycetota bacterium]
MAVKESFMGFARPDGGVGARNHVAVIPSVACANGVVEAIAREVPGATPLFHGHGCGRGGEDLGRHFRTLVNLAVNPNVFGTLVVGLGCEVIKAEYLAERISHSGRRVEFLNIQDVGGSRRAAARGAEAARALLREAERAEREEASLDRVVLGLECGGSDAFSGVTANPAVGLVADWLVGEGGTVILTETTEMIGTAHILARRSRNGEIAGRVTSLIAEAERRAREILGPLASQVIAPGNMDGGMSSIREKSLGCILKGGGTTVNEVVDYGDIPREKGLVIMDGPGYDVESMAGLAACGCQAMLFTTGRGNPLGFPIVPVIKVASNSRLFRAMEDDMDVNAGAVLEGSSLEEVAAGTRALLLRVLNGEETRSEVNRQHGILCLYSVTPAF